MKIIQHPTFEDIITYERVYGSAKGEMYFAFACNETGLLDETKLHESAIENYKSCEAGTKIVNNIPMVFIEIKKTESTIKTDRIGVCDDCDAKIHLTDPLTNTCDCGAEYNMSGQRLKPRSEWEENMDDDY